MVDNIEKVFNADEMELKAVEPDWTEEELLNQEGIFFLKDVAAKLDLHPQEFKKHAKELENQGKNPWQVMGIRKTWTHWQVRMKVFGSYFRSWHLPRIHKVQENWDGNTLLSQKGQFYLSDVCGKIPFSTHQIRHQIRKSEDPASEYGVWKDPAYKGYLVQMEVFSEWIKKIWTTGDFHAL
ncbi:MAG: hypothetical protein QNK37_30990 [Acidobacteriota bacterium]|nr:hypothetical protein [Acidobacteriota bacterium]